MPKTYTTRFTVKGTGYFPLDMLRYDQCYPADSNDAATIGYTYVNSKQESRDVRLKHTHDHKFWQPTNGRWSSFGWAVTESETT